MAYSTKAERDAAAVEWLLDGAQLGQRLLAVTADDDAGAGVLRAIAEARGATLLPEVRTVGIDELYDLSAPIDADSQLARYSDEVARAVADGFNGARVFCDITPLITEPARRIGHARWEHIADGWIAEGNPLAPLCAYDIGVLGDGAQAVMAVHPLRYGPDAAVTQFGLYCGPTCRVLNGEIDFFSVSVLADALAALPAGPVDVDASELSFLCARAAVTLAHPGNDDTPQTRLRLLGAQPMVHRMWEILGLDPHMLAAPAA